MALLNFKYGVQQNLPAFNHTNDGNVYVTTDSKRMFVVLPDQTDYVGLGDFHLVSYAGSATVTAQTSLAALPASLKRTNILYLTVDTANSNATAMFRYDGANFVAISNTVEIDAIKNNITNLQTAVSALETFRDTTVPATYMPLAGGQFTGDVTFKSGKYLSVNAPTQNAHAATKQYVDEAKSALLGASGATTTTGATIYDVKRAAAAAQQTADNAATAASNANTNANGRVSKAGDTMTGPLTLSGDPTGALHAATKQYVDSKGNSALSDAKDYTDEREAAIMGDENSSADSATVHGVKKKAEANATAINTINGNIDDINEELDTKAPIKHAVDADTYGLGTSGVYGHVKLSDSTSSSSAASAGIAATPKAVKAAYDKGAEGLQKANDAYAKAEANETAIGNLNTNLGNNYVKRDGSNAMTGALTLIADNPTQDQHAAHKKYVDAAQGRAESTAQGYVNAAKTAILGTNTDGSNYAGTVKGAYDNAAAANTLAGQAKTVADAAMPKAGGTFSGNVTMGSGKTLTVNTPTADGHAATKKYVDEAKAAAISAVQGKTGDTKDSATVVGAKLYTDDKITTVNSEINTLKTNIGNLSNIMNFLGTTTSDVKQDATITAIVVGGKPVTAVKGDVVVKGAKEFVFDGSKWQEIGDVSAQSTAIDGLLGRMTTAEGDIDSLEGRMTTAEGDIDKLETWKATHETEYTNLEGRVDTAETDIDNLQKTVGTKPTGTGIPDMDNTLWEEVSDLRADLGEKNAAAGTATAFARIKQVETYVGTSGDAASTNALTTGSLYARVKKNANDITSINTAIGSASDAASNTGSIYARIKDNDALIANLTTVLTWGTF
jgi:hypothetical protein